MQEEPERRFFAGKAAEAERRAAEASTEEERHTWQSIAREYRRLSEVKAEPAERR